MKGFLQNKTMRSQSASNLIKPTSNAGNPLQAAMQPPQQQIQPGSDKNVAEKLSEVVPQYLLRRIFANINEIYRLVMGGGWHKQEFKSLIENEIQELTKNIEHPSLKVAINELTKAADAPLTLFIKNFTDIIKKHIDDITYKITSMAGNLVGEIPGVNVVTNSILAASNAVHVAKNVTQMGKELVENIQTFKNDMTTVMNNFNPSMSQQFSQQMTQPYPQQSQQFQYGKPLQYAPQIKYAYGGGSNTDSMHNMKDAKKHLHHLHRKKNRTLRRIHHSIHQFLTSSRNKRSIKAKTKH